MGARHRPRHCPGYYLSIGYSYYFTRKNIKEEKEANQ